MKSRGAKGLHLEVGAGRAPRLLVETYFFLSFAGTFPLVLVMLWNAVFVKLNDFDNRLKPQKN